MPTTAPTTYETELWLKGNDYVAGIDEVGRGAWAGPLVIAAVILPKNFFTTLPINDSKKTPKKLRETLAQEIKNIAISYKIVEVSVDDINAQGLAKAGSLGFFEATKLEIPPDHILIDAFKIKDYPAQNQTAIIKGDQKSLTIAAASIIAKVYRDTLMQELHELAPDYGFNTHVGYGTAFHRQAIKKFGLSKFHRTSYNLSKWL